MTSPSPHPTLPGVADAHTVWIAWVVSETEIIEGEIVEVDLIAVGVPEAVAEVLVIGDDVLTKIAFKTIVHVELKIMSSHPSRCS